MRAATAVAQPAPAPEKRLVLRMLEFWRRARREEQLPLADALAMEDVGADRDHVYIINVLNPGGPRFSFVGTALEVEGWATNSDGRVADCPAESVLGHTSSNWREIVERAVPVTRGGIGRHQGAPVLYRSIMMPFVDESGVISVILGAANWRPVEEQHGVPIE